MLYLHQIWFPEAHAALGLKGNPVILQRKFRSCTRSCKFY